MPAQNSQRTQVDAPCHLPEIAQPCLPGEPTATASCWPTIPTPRRALVRAPQWLGRGSRPITPYAALNRLSSCTSLPCTASASGYDEQERDCWPSVRLRHTHERCRRYLPSRPRQLRKPARLLHVPDSPALRKGRIRIRPFSIAAQRGRPDD